MNTDDTRFDRLVDDELSEEERRELLGRLDDEPSGWRRCALAFLEAQCWRQALGETPSLRDSLGAALQSTGKNADETPAIPIETPRRAVWLGRVKMLSAMAASFLVAMWLGTMAHRAWVGQSARSAGAGPIGEVAEMAKGLRPFVTPDRPENGLGKFTSSGRRRGEPLALGNGFRAVGRAASAGLDRSARRRTQQHRRAMGAERAAGNSRQRLAGARSHRPSNRTAAGVRARPVEGRPAVGRAGRSGRTCITWEMDRIRQILV